MDYRTLGRSGLRVSPICLGTMTFGEADENSFMHKVGCTQEESFAIMDAALDAGINFWDTANVYGHVGLSESIIGEWFRGRGRRDEVVLATKFRFRMHEGPNGAGASRTHIRQAVEESLSRLETDYIDLYQIHMQDSSTPEPELLGTLNDLVREGKVRYIGCSNYTAHKLVDSIWTSKTQRLEGFVTAQMQYSLLERSIEREHVPACRDHGLGILAWSPLAGGMLTGRYRQNEAPPSGSRLEKWKDNYARRDTPQNWEIVEALIEVSKELGQEPAAVALAWVLAQPSMSSAIVGARNCAQLQGSLKALEFEIPKELLDRLNQVSMPKWGYPYDFIERVCGGW